MMGLFCTQYTVKLCRMSSSEMINFLFFDNEWGDGESRLNQAKRVSRF